MRVQRCSFQPRAALPTRASSSGGSDLRRAVDSFVGESNSSEGRRIKTEALRQIQQVAPDLSASHIHALVVLVYPSTSLEGRAAKLRGSVRLFRERPDLTPSFLRDVADFVNDSNGSRGYSMKFDYLVDMMRLKPDLDESFVSQLTRLMHSSNSLEGKSAKLSGVKQLLRSHPDLSLQQLRPIVGCVNRSESATGYGTKFSGFSCLLRQKPDATPSFLSAVSDFICESNSSEGYHLKFGYLGKMLDKRPDLDESFLSELTWLMSASNSIPGKSAKLDGVYQVLLDHPTVTSQQLRGIINCVNRSNNPTAYQAKFQGFREVLNRRPDASERFLRALGSFIDTADGTKGRIDRMLAVLNMLSARPELEAEDIELATQAASQGLGEIDARHRVEVNFWQRQVEAKIEAAGDLPDPPDKMSAPLVAAAVQQPEVVAAFEALRLSQQRLAYYRGLSSASRQELFGKERELHARQAARYSDTRSLHLGLTVAAGALTLAVPPLWAFQPAVFWVGALGYGFKGRALTRKVSGWLFNGKIEKQMREGLKAPERYWERKVNELQEAERQATRAAIRRLHQEGGWSGAGGIEVEEHQVKVGGIILNRKSTDS